MKASIDGGRAILEFNAGELRTLFIAIDNQLTDHLIRAEEFESMANARDRMARARTRGRVAHRRTAGEYRNRAAGHRALASDAGDLRRVLHTLTRDPAVK